MRRSARALLVAAALLPTQAPAQTPTFRASVELVEVAVVVRDRDGRFVPGPYLLRIALGAPADKLEREVPFEIRAAAAR
jgi:hypothetical protein